MAFDTRDSIDFGKTKIATLFSKIFFPTLLGMIFNMAFVLTDGIFIGNKVGSDGLACINLIAPMMMLFSGLGLLFGIGVSVVAAIHLAKNNTKAARINVTQAFWAAGVLALFLGLVLYVLAEPVIRLLGTPEALFPMAEDYFLWFIPTCLFISFETIGTFVIRLDGAPKYAMTLNMVAALVNVVMDYLLIYPMEWGLMGAALATDIGGAVGTGMVFWYMLKRVKVLSFYRLKHSWTSVCLTLRNVGYMVRMGLPGFISEFAIATMFMAGNYAFVHYLGKDGVAAFSIACYLFPVVVMIINSVAQSAQPILSYNHGAGDTVRVRKTLRFSVATALVCGVAAMLLLNLFCGPIVSAFLHKGLPAYELATAGIPYFTSGFIFFAINITLIGYFQSIEKAKLASWLTILRGVVFPVVAFWVLPSVVGIPGLWLAVPASELLLLPVWVLLIKRG